MDNLTLLSYFYAFVTHPLTILVSVGVIVFYIADTWRNKK